MEAVDPVVEGITRAKLDSKYGGDVKKMPQSGYMQEGGSVDDPLEIDMRMRSNNVQAIGVARPRPDSEEDILRDLAKMQRDIKLLQFVKPRYPKANSFNEYRRISCVRYCLCKTIPNISS